MATRIPRELSEFAKYHVDVEAVLQRIGRNMFDVVAVDPDGNWVRAVFPSKEDAEAAADRLGMRTHDGWNERMSARMNRRDHWGEPGGQRRAL